MYSSLIHRKGTAAPEVEKDILNELINNGIFKVDGENIFTTKFLKDSDNIEIAKDRIFRGAAYRDLYLQKHNIPVIDDRYAETMTGNTGKNILARSPAERYHDEQKMVDQLTLGKK